MGGDMKFIALLFLAAALAWGIDEKEVEGRMKATGDAMGELRKSMQAGNMTEAAKHARVIEEKQSGLDAYWTGKNLTQAATWSKDGVVAAGELAKALEAGAADTVRPAMGKLGGTCKSCHDAHREKLPDGTYRLKQ